MTEATTGDAARPRCLVFGGSGAVGSETCRVLAREGARVAFTYHGNAEKARSLAEEIPGSFACRVDLADFEDAKRAVRSAAEELGGLDALVMAAGHPGDDVFYECVAPGNYDKLGIIDRAAFDAMIAVNTRGTLAACQAAAPFLRASAGGPPPAGGNIVIIGSIDGLKSVPTPVHFATSKAALKGMVESMSKELGNYNVRVNIVAPGILEEGGSAKLPESLTSAYVRHCSLGRLGTAHEVAEVAAWFALENTYITGQSILLDGGL